MGKGKKVWGTGAKADFLRRNTRRHWGVLDLVHLPSVESLMCAVGCCGIGRDQCPGQLLAHTR